MRSVKSKVEGESAKVAAAVPLEKEKIVESHEVNLPGNRSKGF